MITGAKVCRAKALTALAIVYALYVTALGGLAFPLTGDETHFWYNAVESFGRAPWPSLAALRSYNELNTPLPFVLWGTLEYWLGQGLWLPRLLNLALSFTVATLIAVRPGGITRRSAVACACLLLCPYYLFVSARVYTDMPAIFCSALGVWAYLQRRFAWSAALFVLAVATRQYAVAFPLAIAAYEVMRGPRRSRAALLAAAVPIASLFGWVWFFGAIAPPEALTSQSVPTAPLAVVIPENLLYLLACAGFYFTLPYSVAVDRRVFERLRRPRAAVAIASVVLLFLLFPPTGNHGVDTATMGLLDRLLHAAHLPPAARGVVLCALATAAVLSLLDRPLALIFTIVNALVMLKAHLAWDKYAVPLVAVLWLLVSREAWDSSDRERTH